MNKTVKDLVVGNEYIFIETNPNKSKDLNIVRAILKSNDSPEGDPPGRGWYPLFETTDKYKGEFFFIRNLEEGNEPLDMPLFIWVNSNYDKPEAKEKLEELFGTAMNPIGYTICDVSSVEETINQYAEFLVTSIEKYENKINDMMEDLKNKRTMYTQQIEWLNKYLK